MNSGDILIVEPNKELLISRTKTISKSGYRVTGVATIEEALKALIEQDFELLVLHPDEPELLDLLLARFPTDMAVLIIAATGEIGRVAVSAGTGIHSFLIEPFTAAKLREAVGRALNDRRLIEEGFRNKTLASLGQAKDLFTPGIDIDKFFNIVAEMSAAGTDADYVSLVIRDEITKTCRVKLSQGLKSPDWDLMCTETTATQPILVNEGLEEKPELVAMLKKNKASSLLMVPLVIKKETVGAINLVKALGKSPFTESDMNFTAVLGWWGSIALENHRLFSQVAQQREQVDSLLQEVSHAQENERKRVAIEIHDGVAQWMVGATYGIKACSALISQSRLAELESELAKIGQTLQKSVRELRRTIANLRPLALEEGGLLTAIRRVIQPLADEGMKCEINVEGELPALSFPQETTTYWVLQEALTNARSHSAATRVDIGISSKDSQVYVSVKDNGIGFNSNEVIKNAIPLEHMGLLGMQERARLLGGNLTIESHPGMGTAVLFTFPLVSYGLVNAIV